MLQDAVRNRAYERAIDTAVKALPEAAVFDIGSGCGLLSMMAAASGASLVTGCEVNPHIARVAQKIVLENGLAERVRILNKDCRNAVLGQDLPERANLAVFEMFDCSLIGEGILHFLAHAREHLLAADARYIPMSGCLRAIGIECRLEHLLGFDVNLLNPYRFSSSFLNVDAGQLQWRALTDPFEVFSFDFSKATAQAESKPLRIPVTAEGTIGAILFWFDVQVEEGCVLSNAPTANSTLHWKQGLQWLPEVHVGTGMQLPLVASHDGSSLRFRWESEGLPKEAFSRLPRFDPHWWKEYTELVRQTHDMLGHCMRHPEEYVKLAALAQRFAIDPGAHDLDPAVAQRFAAAFFTH
jgi:type II protein arginine methyltransferase